jgi:hypothetical protein
MPFCALLSWRTARTRVCLPTADDVAALETLAPTTLPEFCRARIASASVTAVTEQAVGNPYPPRHQEEETAMARVTNCPRYLALRPYLKTFGGVVALVVVWTGLVQF